MVADDDRDTPANAPEWCPDVRATHWVPVELPFADVANDDALTAVFAPDALRGVSETRGFLEVPAELVLPATCVFCGGTQPRWLIDVRGWALAFDDECGRRRFERINHRFVNGTSDMLVVYEDRGRVGRSYDKADWIKFQGPMQCEFGELFESGFSGPSLPACEERAYELVEVQYSSAAPDVALCRKHLDEIASRNVAGWQLSGFHARWDESAQRWQGREALAALPATREEPHPIERDDDEHDVSSVNVSKRKSARDRTSRRGRTAAPDVRRKKPTGGISDLVGFDLNTGETNWRLALPAPQAHIEPRSRGRYLTVFSDLDREFLCIDPDAGALQWQRRVGPNVHLGTTVITDERSVIDAATGETLWSLTPDEAVRVVAGAVVVTHVLRARYTEGGATLYMARDARTGEQLWERQGYLVWNYRTDPLDRPRITFADSLSQCHEILAVHARTGTIAWAVPYGGELDDRVGVQHKGGCVVVTDRDDLQRPTVVIDDNTGTVIAQEPRTNVLQVQLYPDVYIFGTGRRIIAKDPGRTEVRWTAENIVGVSARHKDTLAAFMFANSFGAGPLVGLDANSGAELWTGPWVSPNAVPSGARRHPDAPVVAMAVGTDLRVVGAIDLATGELLWCQDNLSAKNYDQTTTTVVAVTHAE